MTDGGAVERQCDGDSTAPPDREAVVRHVRARARAIRDREVRRALDRVEAAGGHTEHHRETVRSLGDSLTASLVDPVVETVRETDDEQTLAVELELFEA